MPLATAEQIATPTPTAMLAHVGWALYGQRWTMPLAKALHCRNRPCRHRQVWRWLDGESEPDREVLLALADILNCQQLKLNEVAHDLECWLASTRESSVP